MGGDEIYGVGADGTDILVLDILAILVRQFESGTEFGIFNGSNLDSTINQGLT